MPSLPPLVLFQPHVCSTVIKVVTLLLRFGVFWSHAQDSFKGRSMQCNYTSIYVCIVNRYSATFAFVFLLHLFSSPVGCVHLVATNIVLIILMDAVEMSFISRVLWGQFYEDYYGNPRELTWRNRAYGPVFRLIDVAQTSICWPMLALLMGSFYELKLTNSALGL